MNREETHALYAEGRDAWNAWAERMLAERKRLEEAGEWAAERHLKGDLEPKNDATRAWFDSARAEFSTTEQPHAFEADVDFGGWVFPGAARFERATFSGNAWFVGATFSGDAGFGQATYEGAATYADARFLAEANFEAILSKRAFSLANAEFNAVPDFIQAHFEEAPRLDNVRLPLRADASIIRGMPAWRRATSWPRRRLGGLVKRLFQGNRDVPARWRALKRLAIEAHDHENEQRFFAMEMRSARFAGDWPLPLSPLVTGPGAKPWREFIEKDLPGSWSSAKPTTVQLWTSRFRWLAAAPLIALPITFWRPEAWAGFFRFWAGLAYQVTSDFGRSVLRPLALFAMITLVAAGLFLKEHHALSGRDPPTLVPAVLALAEGGLGAWMAAQPCVVAGGLTAAERAQTNAANEALHLAFRNAFLVLDGGADASHRVYGCLYGLATYGDNPVPIVPSAVAYLSIVQKILSAVALFLLGLAVRNMLKMR